MHVYSAALSLKVCRDIIKLRKRLALYVMREMIMSNKTITLYRFEKFEDKRIETILNNKIWLSPTNNFNDLSDCRLSAMYYPYFSPEEFKVVSKAAVLLREINAPAPLLSRGTFDKLLECLESMSTPNPQKREVFQQISKRSLATRNTREELLSSVNICCFFSGDIHEPLMWAHYADNHQGFCVEYEYIPQEESSILQVNYTSQITPFSALELLLCPEESLTRLYTTKSIHWSYEKEFRYIELDTTNLECVSQGQAVDLPSYLSPKRIICGDKACRENVQQLKEKTDLPVEIFKTLKYRLCL